MRNLDRDGDGVLLLRDITRQRLRSLASVCYKLSDAPIAMVMAC